MSEPERPPGWLQTVASVLAAFFGVQSSRNRVRDFRHGKAMPFIFVGLAVTVALVLTVVLIVRLVLRNAGL